MNTKLLEGVPPMHFREFMETNDFTLVVTNCFRESGMPYTKVTIENGEHKKACKLKVIQGIKVREPVIGTASAKPELDNAIAGLVVELSACRIHFGQTKLLVPVLRSWTGEGWESEAD